MPASASPVNKPEGIRSAFNGAIKFEITIDEQGKIHVNFLDKEGNKVKTKGAVKLTMPVKEGMTPPLTSKGFSLFSHMDP